MADPITAEQVARAIEAARSDEGGISDALGGWQWDKRAPDYVRVAWGKPSLPDFIAALTRWHAELVAAETPRKAPDDTAPERLRERREALGWHRARAADGMPLLWHDIERLETGRTDEDAADRARYAAALSAAEAERAAKSDHLAYADSPVWDDGPLPRPALLAVPASPPAPEVVDVPQPIVKRCACPDVHDDVEAEWRPGEPYLTVTHTTVPLAILRAMLEAIDAQQGGA